MRPSRRLMKARRGLAQKLWEFSNELNAIAQTIRYADKPADLTWPISQMIQMTRRLDVFRDQWLLRWIKSESHSLERWPKIWERYL